MRNIIKYVGIILVIAGVLLVMKNLFAKDSNWNSNDQKENKIEEVVYYNARIKLLDKETDYYLTGAKLVLKDENNKIVGEWTTEAGVHLINKLEKGKYTLTQTEAPEGYHLSQEVITFEIKSTDKEVTMYNTKMTEEEIKAEKAKNTTANEVGVDNTASSKSILSVIVAIITTILGISLIYKEKKNY